MITQWLLIGGPAHGHILPIKGGSQVRYPHTDGEDYLYVAENFLHRGNVHRLGVCHSEANPSDADKAALIDKTAHPPMAELVPRGVGDKHG